MDLPKLRRPDEMLLVRTDFSDDDAWETVCDEVLEPDEDGYTASITPVDDPYYAGRTLSDFAPRALADDDYWLIFLADAATFASPEHPILVVDMSDDDPGEAYRALPGQVGAIEANMMTGNLFWHEFTAYRDSDGVFRGFPVEPLDDRP
jgi:hypothetical protein